MLLYLSSAIEQVMSTGQIHDPVIVSVHQWDPRSILWRAFFFPPLFFSPPLSPRLAFLFFPSFFCPPLISSSPFPLPSFLFSFYYSFPIRFLSFLLLVSPFCCFSFSLSYLSFIFLILPPFPPLSLSHSFCFCFLALKFLFCFTSLPRGML